MTAQPGGRRALAGRWRRGRRALAASLLLTAGCLSAPSAAGAGIGWGNTRPNAHQSKTTMAWAIANENSREDSFEAIIRDVSVPSS